jgi:hypothetical protein
LVQTTEGLDLEQERTAIELLGMAGPRMSAAFYNAAARLFALTAIETVILREQGKDLQVYLALRPPRGRALRGASALAG